MAKRAQVKRQKGANTAAPAEVGKIQVYVPERFREGGAYSNIANINVSDNEVVINFVFADRQGASVVSKVILSHDHAENFIQTFKKILSKHNKKMAARKK
ncbi:MAG: DUF3467 domain-containing protein [Candidatus Kerfeldbacteria bacterium]|nr:DUF3467 domain-containing protein [Candidatus Kerfeldbacteria bacterium]